MKIISFLLILTTVGLLSCNNTQTNNNKFSSSDRILKLQTTKHKGCGLFSPSASSLPFQKPSENHLGLDFKIPKTIDSVKIATIALDIKPFFYKEFKTGNIDTVSFNQMAEELRIDTISLPKPEITQNYLSILKGNINDSTIIIVDQNNNLDFSDDTIREIEPMQWKSTKSLIEFNYQIFNGSDIVSDHSWINIGKYKNSVGLLSFVSQHVSSTFSIDDNSYSIAIFDDQWSCTYDRINIALIEENGIKKDTLFTQDYLKRGEYLKLGNYYYKFENISNDGSRIKLIKEDNFEGKIGTQIGMFAPDFKCHSTQGDTISLKDYKEKYLLLVNVSSCWSKVSSYACYKDLTKAFNEKLNFLGIDNSPNFLQQNIKELNLKGKFIIAEDNNNSIQKNYRPYFCSRTCFLISPEGRILDKFEIFDWKSALSKHPGLNQ